MIAPFREADVREAREPASEEMVRARRLVATVIMPPEPQAPIAPPIPGWKAWLIAGWMALVTAAFAARMAGFWG